MTVDTAPPPVPAAVAYDLGPPRGGDYCAPLGQAPAWERVLRYALALLVVGVFGFYVVQTHRSPTRVTRNGGDSYGTLLNDVADGEVVTIDDSRARYIVWRTRDGDVFAEHDPDSFGWFDLRASVAAQPYVRANPSAIRYERIDAPIRRDGGWIDVLARLGLLAFLSLLVTGPQPRLFTRWGWFWFAWTGVGLVAYLLFAGSRRRTRHEAPERITGGHALFLACVTGLLLAVLPTPWRDLPDRPSESLRPGTAEQVKAPA